MAASSAKSRAWRGAAVGVEDRHSCGNGSDAAAQAREEEARWGLHHGCLDVSAQSPCVTPLTLCNPRQRGKGKRKVLRVVRAAERGVGQKASPSISSTSQATSQA